jgi:hypothetical protein
VAEGRLANGAAVRCWNVGDNKKPTANFEAAGFDHCDDGNIAVICPTCQIFRFRACSDRPTGLAVSAERPRLEYD